METYANQILSNWNGKPLEGAKTMIQKYGYPQEATISQLIWHHNGPWKRTAVRRDTVPHNFMDMIRFRPTSGAAMRLSTWR
ncbi:hypothetical protein SAMN05192534_109123 [Alteribacillus persepolensis]|uniref:Uncharacterized protein n=1 Tax=Alteribacillus persepolensis TaxID=568899 RepID=A0A1G8EJE7_9BACI|nr:hypothetical protein SAMN05192534_109123 [Alteribacillus persepolensis]